MNVPANVLLRLGMPLREDVLHHYHHRNHPSLRLSGTPCSEMNVPVCAAPYEGLSGGTANVLLRLGVPLREDVLHILAFKGAIPFTPPGLGLPSNKLPHIPQVCRFVTRRIEQGP